MVSASLISRKSSARDDHTTSNIREAAGRGKQKVVSHAATAGRDFHTSDGDYEVGPTELHGDSVEHFCIVVEPEN